MVIDLTSTAKYKTDIPDRTDKLTTGEFVVPFDEGKQGSFGVMIEGYFEAPETGVYRFFATRYRHVLCERCLHRCECLLAVASLGRGRNVHQKRGVWCFPSHTPLATGVNR